jgi:hypothetical protein
MSASSRRAAIRDADQRVALHEHGEDVRAACARGHEEPQLPGDDLGDEPDRPVIAFSPIGRAPRARRFGLSVMTDRCTALPGFSRIKGHHGPH